MSKYNGNDGIEEGDRVVMVKDGYLAKEGDRGELIKDDCTHAPKFKWDNGMESYEHLKNMKPLTLDDAKPSEWDEAAKAAKAETINTGALTPLGLAHLEALGNRLSSTVEAPAHYNAGGVECIDYIRQQLGEEGFIAYCEGNVIKYQHRYKYKGGLQDLKKARKYQEWMMEALEAKEAVELEAMKGRNR